MAHGALFVLFNFYVLWLTTGFFFLFFWLKDLGSPSSFLQVRAIVRAALARKWASLTPSPGYCLPAARSLFRFARRSHFHLLREKKRRKTTNQKPVGGRKDSGTGDVVKASDGMRPSPEEQRPEMRCDRHLLYSSQPKSKKNPGARRTPPVLHSPLRRRLYSTPPHATPGCSNKFHVRNFSKKIHVR